MFTHLRDTAKGFFARLILFFLVGMFVLWGIGDVLRSRGADDANTAATVDGTVLSLQELHATVERTHRPPSEALAGMINDLLIDKETASLGITVGDEDVARYIKQLPSLKGADGAFDKTLYQELLQSARLSEGQFVNDIRHELADKLLIGTLTDGIVVPKLMVEAAWRADHEQREGQIMRLSSASLPPLPAPTDKELQTYYDAHKDAFMAPETRVFSYVTLPIGEVASTVSVPDDEVKRAYEERQEEFRQPERRDIDQLIFADEASAKKASAQLAAGAAFDKVAAGSVTLNKNKWSMGELRESDLPPQAASAGLFMLKAGQASAPVQSDFGWHVFYVKTVVPAGQLTLEQARPQIARDIAARDAQDTATKVMNGFEDAMAGGAPLEQAAQKINIKVQHAGPVTRDSAQPDGAKASLPYPEMLTTAFATGEKEHSQAAQTADGSYYLLQVDTVAPAHVRPLTDVLSQVKAAVTAQKANAALETAAQSFYEQLQAGKPLPQALAQAKLVNVYPAGSGALTRASDSVAAGPLKGAALPGGFTGELFRLQPGNITHPFPDGKGNYLLMVLEKVTPSPSPANDAALIETRDRLKETLSNEILHQYLTYLRGKYKLTVNAQAILKSTGEQ